MNRTVVLGSLGATTVGLVLLATPLISCGCLEPWHSFLAASGVPNWQDRENLDSTVIELAAKALYVGKQVAELGKLTEDKSIPMQCRQQSASAFDCDFWLMQGLVTQSGFQVKAEAARDGFVSSVSVSRVHKLFGYRI